MWLGVLCDVTFIIVGANAQLFFDHSKPLQENEACLWEGDDLVWYCKKDSDCLTTDVILKNGGKFRTCSWQGDGRQIICCPPSISQRKCADYENQLCYGSSYRGPDKKQVKTPVLVRPIKTEAPEWFYCWIYAENNTLIRLSPKIPVPPGVRGDCSKNEFGYGGYPAEGAEFPYMALIGYGAKDRISWQCGGSLINERFVLSAAHCSSSTTFGPAKWARLGDLNYLSDTDDARPQDFEIIERFVHRGYKPPPYYNDIVLYKLDRDVVFDQYVGPLCLNQNPRDPQGSGIATGWGRNESNGPKISTLIKVDLDFISTEKCKSSVGTAKGVLPQGIDPKTMICAGRVGKDTCQGDSGGPLVREFIFIKERCLHRQVGVISFGPKRCGITPVPGVYVRVSHFIHWIESIAWPEERFKITL